MFRFKRKLFYSKMFQDQLENLHDRLKTDTFTYLDFRTTLEGIRFVSHPNYLLSLLREASMTMMIGMSVE